MPKWCTFLVTIERQESGVNRKTAQSAQRRGAAGGSLARVAARAGVRLNPRRRRSSTMPPPFFPIPRTVCVGAASEWGRGPLEAGCGLARGDRASALATRNGTRRRVSGACRSAARHGRATRRATRGKSWLPREGGRDRYTSYIYMADTRTHDNHINAMSMRLRPKTYTHATLPHTMTPTPLYRTL